MITWEASFRVGETQVLQDRYTEIANSIIPTALRPKVDRYFNFIKSCFATDFDGGEPPKPYAVYMRGQQDENGGAYNYYNALELNA